MDSNRGAPSGALNTAAAVAAVAGTSIGASPLVLLGPPKQGGLGSTGVAVYPSGVAAG